eukprot:gene30819-37235_t
MTVSKSAVAIILLSLLAVVIASGITASQSFDFNLDFGTDNPYKNFNNWLNGHFFRIFQLQGAAQYLHDKLGEETGYYAQCYLRDLVGGTFVYWGTAG